MWLTNSERTDCGSSQLTDTDYTLDAPFEFWSLDAQHTVARGGRWSHCQYTGDAGTCTYYLSLTLDPMYMANQFQSQQGLLRFWRTAHRIVV